MNNDFDLTSCAICTDELHQKKYAKTLHPDHIEDIFRGIRQGQEHLTLRKLKKLNN